MHIHMLVTFTNFTRIHVGEGINKQAAFKDYKSLYNRQIKQQKQVLNYRNTVLKAKKLSVLCHAEEMA